MKTLIYINQCTTTPDLEQIFTHLKKNQINKQIEFLKEEIPFDTYWDQHPLILNNGDTLIINDITNLSAFVGSALDYINNLLQSGIDIHFAKYNIIFDNNSFTLTHVIDLLQEASKKEDIIIHPSFAHRNYKMPGRPKGSRNKSLKLDVFKTEIHKYLSEGHTHAIISKLVNCHPTTLKFWINERQNLLNSNYGS